MKKHRATPKGIRTRALYILSTTERTASWRKSRRQKVIDGYGGKCKCCGEDEILFLTIDHINNDGKADRKRFATTAVLYGFLIRNNFPTDRYRLLCFNCNLGRFYNGGICPHEVSRIAAKSDPENS